MLEYFRNELDSEFMTTYKYSEAEYTRKYLGLTQVRKLIETFPILSLDTSSREKLKELIMEGKSKEIINFLSGLKSNKSNKPKKSKQLIIDWF